MKLPVAMGTVSLAVAAIAAIELGTVVSDEVLEPSLRNEVDHALSREVDCAASTGAVRHAALPAAWTNGLSVSAQAVRLVSLQKSDGRWLDGTNDVTRSVISVLRSL